MQQQVLDQISRERFDLIRQRHGASLSLFLVDKTRSCSRIIPPRGSSGRNIGYPVLVQHAVLLLGREAGEEALLYIVTTG